ncbi:uncharacterized protein LOC135479743 [Liolophura sinensis]|uniref:uncharacterized protein LOC135479743 n=1 Tax=Liolophura sinensis TaxID=3198878 RepID=UPI003158E315
MASKSARQRSTAVLMQNCEYPSKTNPSRKRQRRADRKEIGDCLGQEDHIDKKVVRTAGDDEPTFRVPGPRKRRKRQRPSTDPVSPGQPVAKTGPRVIQQEAKNGPETKNGRTGTPIIAEAKRRGKDQGDTKGFEARWETKNVQQGTRAIVKENGREKHGDQPMRHDPRPEVKNARQGTPTIVEENGRHNHSDGSMRSRSTPEPGSAPSGFHQIRVPYLNAEEVRYRSTVGGMVKIFGEGEYGYVVRGEYTPTGADEAADVVAKYVKNGRSSLGGSHYEARMLAHLSDTGCVPKVYGLLKDETGKGEPAIVQECVGGGLSLEDVLKLKAAQSTWVEVCLQSAQGLEKIHAKHVLLNDIKADNILVACAPGGNNIRFIDMGMASYKCGVRFRSEASMARSHHLAPEVRECGVTSELSDIYSLGKVIESIALKAKNKVLHAIGQLMTCEDPSERCSLQTVIELLKEFASRMAQIRSVHEQNNL